MKQIPLRGKKGAGLNALVDDEIYPFLAGFKWSLKQVRTCRYAHTYVRELKKNVMMHHMIVQPLKPFVVDHRRGDGLDNQRENLRVTTQQINTLNRHHSPKAADAGVYFAKNHPGRKQFKAYATVNRKTKTIGWFMTKEEAIDARTKFLAAT